MLVLFAMLFAIPTAFAVTQTVGAVTINPSPIELTLGSTKFVTCNSTIADATDWNNIATVNATIWDTSASTEGSANDNNNHYTNASCSLGANTSATERPVECGFSLQYYANPSTWTCKIRSYDALLLEASNEINVTIDPLIALDVTEATIDFGTLALGATSSSDVTATVQNTGNVQIDVNLTGSAFSCATGSLAQENIHYSASSGIAYGSMTALSGTTANLDLNVAKSTGASSTKLTYWKISLPANGAGGTCTDTITFTAVSG
jgi:hypothetical protein